tara:strand:+ start:209 stop:1267 length:1059 start_codon:yes stop_codon:yes gene_type:complete
MKDIDNLTKCSVDSLKIRIPLTLLDDYDRYIVRTVQEVDEETCEIERVFKKTAKTYEFDAFKLTANIFKVNSVDSLILLVNSKQVALHYFKGITLSTIRTIYELCISADILRCSFSTFMKANCTDTDFKKDFPCIIDEYKQMIKGLNVMGLTSTKRGHGVNKMKNDLGIEFNTRLTATISKPFVKVYHKEVELQDNSFDFADRYLSDINYKDIIRIESTVKDKKHFNTLLPGLKDTSLDSILNLTTSQKDIILADSFNRNLQPRTNNRVYDNKELNSKDLLDLQILNTLVNTKSGFTIETALNQILRTQTCKVAKYRFKKRLMTLYNDYILQINYTEKTANINQIYDQIGWN